MLLLYSDGLIEQRHRSLTHGLDTLLEVAAALATSDLEQLCDQLPGRVLAPGRREDDLCLLAARHTLWLTPAWRRVSVTNIGAWARDVPGPASS